MSRSRWRSSWTCPRPGRSGSSWAARGAPACAGGCWGGRPVVMTGPTGAAAPAFFGGLDLGQMADYTALSVLERTEHEEPGKPGQRVRRYAVRHLERWPLRTPYPDIVADVVERYATGPLAGSVLTVDRTGVGVAVFDLLRQARPAARLVPITITGGAQHSHADGCYSVPKRELA